MNKYLKTKEGSLEDLAKQMQNKVLESDYQDKFKKELDNAGKPIGQMTGAEKKAFFNKIDKMYTAKNEQAKNPYAIGMAAAMKAKNDQPPLKKSTITKAHDIAKSIEKDKKEEVKEARWEIEGRVSYKGISSEDGFHMVIDAPNKDAAERKAYNELDKARQRKKIGPGGGGSIDDADIESIEKTNDKLSPPESGPMMNSYDPKLKEDFFVNDKKDTLKKFSGRIGYNKSTLTDYLAKKTNKNKNDVYFDDTELV